MLIDICNNFNYIQRPNVLVGSESKFRPTTFARGSAPNPGVFLGVIHVKFRD